jgi:hypothetical protein
MPKRAKGSSRNTGNICATCSRPFKNCLTGREAREKNGLAAREEDREAREEASKKESSDEEDDVPILELVRRGDYIDTEWRAPGRGKVYEIYKIVDWKVDDAHSHRTDRRRAIFFLVWWKGYTLSESTWEPASGIHPVEQVRFFKSVGVFD